MEFANKTQIDIELGLSPAFAADAIGNAVYTTDQALQEILGDLARLKYQSAKWKGRIVSSAADANAVATVRLNDGVNDLATMDVALAGGTDHSFSVPEVDLSAVSGAAGLRTIVDIKTAGAAGLTAQVASGVTVTHPVVLVGTC